MQIKLRRWWKRLFSNTPDITTAIGLQIGFQDLRKENNPNWTPENSFMTIIIPREGTPATIAEMRLPSAEERSDVRFVIGDKTHDMSWEEFVDRLIR